MLFFSSFANCRPKRIYRKERFSIRSMRVNGDRMSPLSSCMKALMVSAFFCGCVNEPAKTGPQGRNARQGETPTADAEAPPAFALAAPTEAQMWLLRSSFAAQRLGRITATSGDSVLGYHEPTTYKNEQEEALDREFLAAFHAGKYEEIASLKTRFQALLPSNDQTPPSPKVLARLGFLNVWEFGERYRGLDPGETITDQAGLLQSIGACSQYFRGAVATNANNSVYRGFAAICTLLLGKSGAPGMEDELAIGLELAGSAIRRNPEFNLFTIGYILSARPAETSDFELGVEMLWRNLDVCFDHTIDRKNPDVSKYIQGFLPLGNKRFCLNSEISPHNFEGFFLIFGDVLVKAKQPEAARQMYANAKLLPSYQTWDAKFRAILDERIASADQLVTPFRMPVNPFQKPAYPTITFDTEDNCMVCHKN